MKLVRQGNAGYAYNEQHGYSFEITGTERSEIEPERKQFVLLPFRPSPAMSLPRRAPQP